MCSNILHAFVQSNKKNALNWVQSSQNYIAPFVGNMDASPLHKYVYLNGVGATEKEKFIETCRKNFLVYIVTIQTELEGLEHLSEGTSDGGYQKMADGMSHNTDSKHQIETQSESSTYRQKSKRKTKNKQHESNSKLLNFFKKMLPIRTSRCKENVSSLHEMYLRDFIYDGNYGLKDSCLNSDGISKTGAPYVVPMTFIDNTLGESTNAETLHEINSLKHQIVESECCIREMLIKHIQDQDIAKELLTTITNHERLLGDIEKRTTDMTNEHWMQQLEVYKDQQKALQMSMNSIVHQNRELLEENELLSKKNEKLSATLVGLHESSYNSSKKASSRMVLDDLSKNNDRLRHKINGILSQVGSMEDSVKKFQKRCQYLQQQLNNANAQTHHFKGLYEKCKTEHEMVVAKLTYELQNANGIIKDSTEQGNNILQDIEMLKMQLQPIAISINWNKFQSCTRPLQELMVLNRTCINELSSAILYKQKELNMALSEIETLSLANTNLPLLRDEIEELKNKLDQSKNKQKESKDEIDVLKEIVTSNEHKMSSFLNTLAEKEKEIEAKIKMIHERNEEISEFNELITNVKQEYNQLQFNSDKLRHENNALHIQIKGMTQVLTATGAGDIAKELAHSQEKLTGVQTQFFALAAENNILLQQIETNKSERQTLVAYQKNCYEQLQVLHKNIESLEKTNETLQEQLETEKHTVTALQTERVRHLEERSILTAIYERLKSEVNKVDQLEGAVTNMNKKASKLAMIAEYNKQLGDKLQMEVAEKDEAINELQNNVKQLNSFQMESTKEKVALCEELNKVFSVKEVLNTKLTAELEKNVILDESKKEIQNNANLQLKEIQAAYNREHAALKNLVEDVKQLVNERDSLLQANQESENKCINVMMEHDKLIEVINTLQMEYKDKEEKLCEMEKKLTDQINDIEELKMTHGNEINFVRHSLEKTANRADSLNKENEALKASLEYLQTDVNNIRHELDLSRQNEHEFKKGVEEFQNTYNQLYEQYRQKSQALKQIIDENEALKINVYTLGEKFKCLTEENERMSQDSLRLESMLNGKYQTSKIQGLPTPKHVENVLDDINARDEEILVLQEKLREHEERGMEMNDLLQTIQQNRTQTDLRYKQLQQELKQSSQDLQNEREHRSKLESILESLQQSMVPVEAFEEQQKRFTSAIDGLKDDYKKQYQAWEKELMNLNEQKQQLNAELKNNANNLEQYKEAHEKLQKAHKVLALKLFTAVRVLICEKVTLETSQSKIATLEEEKERLVKHNQQKDEELRHLCIQIKEFQQELDHTKCENSSLFEDLTSTRAILSELQTKFTDNTYMNNSTSEEMIKEQEICIAALKKQITECRKTSNDLQNRIANLESNRASLEFEKSEIELRLHQLQMQAHSETERSHEMKKSMQTTLSLIIEMKENGNISPHVHNQLLQSFSDSRV